MGAATSTAEVETRRGGPARSAAMAPVTSVYGPTIKHA